MFSLGIFIRHKEKKIEDEEGMKSDSRTQERRNELLSISFIFSLAHLSKAVQQWSRMRSKASLHHLKSQLWRLLPARP